MDTIWTKFEIPYKQYKGLQDRTILLHVIIVLPTQRELSFTIPLKLRN